MSHPATASARSSWVSSRTRIDLPAPFGPRIAVCSPAQIVSVSPCRTVASPFLTLALINSRTGSTHGAYCMGFVGSRGSSNSTN